MTEMLIGGLFEGCGGLTMAAQALFGGRLAWYSEYEPPTDKQPKPKQGAAKIMAYHHPDVPNLGDITAIDWADVPTVDVLTGGWPCQPWSLAGRQKGAEDDRALWPEVARAVRALRPRHVFLENVAAVVALGELERAVTDLAALGYVGSWLCLPASAVGAPHRRERCFILATDTERGGRDGGPPKQVGGPGGRVATTGSGADVAADARGQIGVKPRGVTPGSTQGTAPVAQRRTGRGRGTPIAADTDRDAIREQPVSEPGRGDTPIAGQPVPAADTDDRACDRARACAEPRSGSAAAYPDGDGQPRIGRQHALERHPDGCGCADIAWGAYEPAIRRWERLTRPAPAPTEPNSKGGRRLSPAFVEWMQGLPAGHVTDPAIGISRNAQLKALGNCVVPQQAAEAGRVLLPVVQRIVEAA